MKPSGPGLSFVGKVLITDSVSLFIIWSIQIFYFFHDSVLVSLLLGIYPFLLRSSWYILFIKISYYSLHFCCISSNYYISSNVSSFLILSLLYGFLGWVGQKFVSFVYLFTKLTPISGKIFCYFSGIYFIYFCCNLCYFLSSSNFGLTLFFFF